MEVSLISQENPWTTFAVWLGLREVRFDRMLQRELYFQKIDNMRCQMNAIAHSCGSARRFTEIRPTGESSDKLHF
jgi:hypothetical protein